MNKNEIIDELLWFANECGIVITLNKIFGKRVKVNIPFDQNACNASIDELGFSVRASNAMKRSNIFKIGEVINLINDDGLLKIRNLGEKTQNEIKTRILLYGYEQLSDKRKRIFLYDVLVDNCISPHF